MEIRLQEVKVYIPAIESKLQQSSQDYNSTLRKWLNVGTVPTFKMHNVGTVPMFKMYHVGTVHALKKLNIGTLKQ